MQKSKIIIIIVASVLAAALVIAGIIFALTNAFTFNPADNSSENFVSSSVTGTNSNEDTKNPDAQGTQSNGNNDSSAQTGNNSGTQNSGSASSGQNGTDANSSSTVSVIPSDCTISAGAASGSKGKTVRVPVSIAANPGIMAMIFDIEYDSSLLKYSGYSKGNVLSDYEFSENKGKLTFLNVEQNNITKNGNLFFLEFEILSDKAQDCEIKISVRDDGFCNYDEQLIGVKSKNGKITIK